MKKSKEDKELEKFERDKKRELNEESKVNEESKNMSRNKNKKNILKKIFGLIFILGIIFIVSGLFLLYGPYNGFRDWFITTAMSTMEHQDLATFFYSDDVIDECLSRNKVIEIQGSTNTDLIDIIDYSKIRRNYI